MQTSDLLRSVGCVDHIPADGKIYRWKPEGSRNKNGWAVLHQDGEGVWGAAGNWATGERLTIRQGRVDPAKVASVNKSIAKRSLINATDAKLKALREWSRAENAGHSLQYLARKQVIAFGLRYHGDTVIIPMSDSDGGLHGLQSISPDGRKLFTKGCAKKGKFHRIPGKGAIVIAEGYATAASIHMATGMECIVAFDAGNLLPVALEMWRTAARNAQVGAKNAQTQIILAADNDPVGRESAIRAAQAVGGRAIWPAIEGTDYNDLHVAEGLTAVADSIYGCL